MGRYTFGQRSLERLTLASFSGPQLIGMFSCYFAKREGFGVPKSRGFFWRGAKWGESKFLWCFETTDACFVKREEGRRKGRVKRWKKREGKQGRKLERWLGHQSFCLLRSPDFPLRNRVGSKACRSNRCASQLWKSCLGGGKIFREVEITLRLVAIRS